jgi:hypothetical protein
VRRKQSGQNGGGGWIEEDELKHCVFITTDKSKDSRGGGKSCRCYDRRLYSIGLAESTTGRAKVWLRKKTWTCVHARARIMNMGWVLV